MGYSVTAQRTGNMRSYLETNSQTMQKTIERVYRINVSLCQRKTAKPRRAYLEPIRDSMQKPVEGLSGNAENVGGRVAIGEKTSQWHVENSSAKLPNPPIHQPIYTLNKGAIAFSEQQFSLNTDYPVIIALETKYIL